MRLRRSRLQAALAADEMAPTIVAFPLMGVGSFVHPVAAAPGGPASRSDTVPDSVINPHPRFGTLTANIRERRGEKVDIQLPVYQDVHTTQRTVSMDCMAYGMGSCCLQVTMQASDFHESLHLYDQLTPLTPILMALTAASPIFQGRLVATDSRWRVISAAVDDRTREERGAGQDVPGAARRQFHKSRYDSVSLYISQLANSSAAAT